MKLLKSLWAGGLLFVAACLAAPAAMAITAGTPGECDTLSYTTHDEAAFCQSRYAPVISTQFTRPANTTVYTTNTAWADNTVGATFLTFTGICRYNAGTVDLVSLHIVDKANQATKLQGVLYLFNVAPTPINDNTAFNIASTDWSNEVASLAFTMGDVLNTGSGAAGAVAYDAGNIHIPVTCGAGDTNLYGMVKVVNAYTPVTSEVLQFKLKAQALN